MLGLGLRPPGSLVSSPQPPAQDMFASAQSPSVVGGGMMRLESAGSVIRQQIQQSRDAASAQANTPIVQGLAAYVRTCWSKAKQAKLPIEQKFLRAVASRRGEYTPEKLSQIRQQGGSEIYMMLFSTKARQASALIRDVMIGAGTDKPWTLRPTKVPDVSPDMLNQVAQAAAEAVHQAEMSGMPMSMDDIRQLLRDHKDRIEDQTMQVAKERVGRMENKMEDQMQEGGWLDALDQFVDDMTTFKTAFLKGPVVRRRTTMKWAPDGVGGYQLDTVDEMKLEWERVDPFHIYPAPWSRDVNDAWLIERHQMDRGSLESLVGVEGYSEDAIRAVLDEHGRNGLHEWLAIDSQRPNAEGRSAIQPISSSDLIDALQFWGPVSGKMLLEWGMDASKVPDPSKEYEAEVWLIGSHVIKSVVNADPLKRRPYYATGFERVPGAFWHNSLFDMVEDCQDMCNAASRSLANNLGISSGPQVVVNVERLPMGEKITEMYPWKLWQTTSDPMGSTALPITFFQPQSNAVELMQVYEKFSQLADETSGIPRYMAGLENNGGAGRTASGLSMMIGNASKTIKQVIGNIDLHVIDKAVSRLYFYNMRYLDDPELKGDVNIVARGALSLTVKEAAQVRRNEFLAATANPIDMQIIGLDGRAELLRQSASSLDMDASKIVPSVSVLKVRAAQAAQAQAAQAAAQQQGPLLPGAPAGNGQELMNGAPTTDHFSPPAQ